SDVSAATSGDPTSLPHAGIAARQVTQPNPNAALTLTLFPMTCPPGKFATHSKQRRNQCSRKHHPRPALTLRRSRALSIVFRRSNYVTDEPDQLASTSVVVSAPRNNRDALVGRGA